MIKVAVDTMGRDFAPGEMVARTVETVNAKPGIRVLLVGQERTVTSELGRYTYNKDQVQVVNATEAVATEEPSINAIRERKDPSIAVGINLVKKEEADTFVSAGSSGAILVDGQVIVGRIRGVERPPLAPLIPTEKGVSSLIDCGTNVDVRASHLVQFAQMGSIYMEHVVGIRNPRIAIVSISTEEEKGNALAKGTFPLLEECEGTNFIGNIEAGEIPRSATDAVVCEVFVGDVTLKLYESVGAALISMVKGGMMSTLRGEIGALLVKPALKQTLKASDGSQYGEAPLSDLNSLVVKTHDNSKHAEVRSSTIQCITFKEQEISEEIRESLGARGAE